MSSRLVMAVALIALFGTAQAQNYPLSTPGDPRNTRTLPTGVPASTTVADADVPVPHTPGGVASGPQIVCPPDAGRSPRFWGGAEYLLWWVQGQRIPALVTTSVPGTPPGSAGVLGLPGTSVLFGDTRINENPRSGFRVTAGMWLDDCRTCGIGGEFFMLEDRSDRFFASSGGSTILARPFINSLSGLPDAQFVAFPGLAAGSVAVMTESELWGAGLFTRHVLCSGCTCDCRSYAVEALAGYRYLNLDERVTVVEQIQTIGTIPGGPPIGTTFGVSDTILARTQFHGGDIGLAGRLNRGPWSLDVMGKLGIGVNVRDITFTGLTQIAAPGSAPTSFPGGLLTAGRTGSITDEEFALVPEFRIGVGYQITERARVTLGYNLQWWTNVVRPGDQIDLQVNPNLLPPPIGQPPVAAIPVRDETIWIQGLNLGLMFNY